jgi:hypothetical protein
MHRSDASADTIPASPARRQAPARCATLAAVRWLRRVLVVAVLLAPIAMVVAIARPDDGAAASGEVRGGGSGADGVLLDGDRVHGDLGFGEAARYRATGDGPTRIGATGGGADLQITVRAVDGGTELASNDDTNGLDPEVTLDLDDGEPVDVEVRELGGNPASFTLYVEAAG